MSRAGRDLAVAPCECCGRFARCRVEVVDRRTCETALIVLCKECIAGERRTWRLRWALLADEEAAP